MKWSTPIAAETVAPAPQKRQIAKKLQGFDAYMAEGAQGLELRRPSAWASWSTTNSSSPRDTATATTKRNCPLRPRRCAPSPRTPSSSRRWPRACWSRRASSPGTNPSANRCPPSASTTTISTTRSPCATCWAIAPALPGTTPCGTSRTSPDRSARPASSACCGPA